MPALTRFFFRAPYSAPKTGEILGPIADSILMRRWGRQFSEVGATLFRKFW